MFKLFFMLLTAISSCLASSIYQVRFVGVFGNGASAFTFGENGQSLSRDLSGRTLRGKISIVMDALPSPATVTEFETGYETLGKNPLWLRDAEFSIDGIIDLPAGFFEPGPYFVESAPVPSNGTNLEPSAYEQRFGVIESLNFLRLGVVVKDVWANPDFATFRRQGNWALNAQGLSGIPYNPQTGQFQAISGVPSFSTGFVSYQNFRSTGDLTSPGSGLIENTVVQGSFTATSVTGEVVVPEPGTWGAIVGGLGVIGLWRRRR